MRNASLRRRSALLLVVGTVGLIATGCSDTTESSEATTTEASTESSAVTQLTPEDANALITRDDAVQVIDVRTPDEFAEGHIAGATNIDVESADFADRIRELDPDSLYVVYCKSGNRSQQATAIMVDEGFTDVNDISGGVDAWEAAGLPLER